MLRERIQLFFAKYSFIKIIFGGIIIGIALYFSAKLYNNYYSDISETSKGVIGTLLGALVGGFFTLVGSLTINKRAQKASNAIKRKNVIYKPLFDELMEIHNEILIDDPYPSFFSFTKEAQTIIKHPQYTVWGRIKNDARIFEVPTKLEKAMETLYSAIENYLKRRSDAVAALDRIYKKEMEKITGIQIHEKANPGYMLLAGVLLGHRPDNDLLLGYRSTVSDKEADDLWNCLLKHAKTDPDLTNCKEARSEWNKAEEDVIKLLGYYIQFIAVKYEG